MLRKNHRSEAQQRHNHLSLFSLFEAVSGAFVGKQQNIPELNELQSDEQERSAQNESAAQIGRLLMWRITSGQM